MLQLNTLSGSDSQVSLILVLVAITIYVLLLNTNRNSLGAISFNFLRHREDEEDGRNGNRGTWNGTAWGRAANDGHWYDFSHPPLFVFYVYSAFLVTHGSQVQTSGENFTFESFTNFNKYLKHWPVVFAICIGLFILVFIF